MRLLFMRRLLVSSIGGLLLLLALAPGAGVSWAAPSACTPPKIAGGSPVRGPVGTPVTIDGCGFTGATAVTFNGTAASFTVVSDTQITTTVPQGATTGLVVVSTPSGPATSPGKFVVLPSLTLSPTFGPPTSALSVSGSNFQPGEGVDIYFDSTDMALASANYLGAFSGISITVPATAVPGTHWVTAIGRSSGLSAQAPFLVQTSWAERGFGPRHKGTNPYENVLSAASVSGLDAAWSAATGSSIQSSPAVATESINGTLTSVVYVGSGDDNLYAFNAQTGAQLWTAATGGSITSSPAVATESINGMLTSVVYVGSADDNLYAFNAQTGAQLWTAATGGSIITSSPAVANGVIYVGSFDNHLYAFNAQTGALLWTAAMGAFIDSSPAVANGVVYVGSSDYHLYAFNAQTGALLWIAGTGYSIESSPAVANGVVYVGSDDSNLYAFNAQTGAQLWTAATSGPIFSSPAVANGVVYVGSFDDNLHAFNAQTGAQLWTAATSGPIFSSPAVANGVVYVGSDDGNLYAFNAQTGALLWTAATGNDVESSPAVTNGMVYVGSLDDSLYAYALNVTQRPKPPARPNPATLRPNRTLRPVAGR